MAVIQRVVAEHATLTPDHPAIVVADGGALTYRDLDDAVNSLSKSLVGHGLSRADTVGIALGDGVDLALAFLAVSNVCATAPLNPSYTPREFAFEIDDLSLVAMIVGVGDAEVPGAVQAARERGIPVLRIVGAPNNPLSIAIETDGDSEPAGDSKQVMLGDAPSDDDIALVLHTSGTTSRPKIVPLTHANIAASAKAIGATLGLTAQDRGCCVMPLFHIHGLMAGLCASLAKGATVISTPGFAAPAMGRWLGSHQASWYTAVPTMHQSVLERMRVAPAEFEAVDLRFIRSSSASLAPTVMRDLEEAFGCPVIESYGMTEAAHQMTSNPLPPKARKAGSVGLPAGPQVAVMGGDGRLLGLEAIGEVVIQGPSVMSSYNGDSEADRGAFEHGWFRTGDQGRMDRDGYLYLTGRIKEIINRAGENVSPREVDEVLLEHPSVAQAVTFSVPDSRLGEQVAAAVVLHEDPDAELRDAEAEERRLRHFVADRLAPYKVPRRIVLVDEIPTGPSGKLRRIGLADELSLAELDHAAPGHVFEPPSTAAQCLLAELWTEVLARNGFGVWDHFLDVGGDSLAATQLLTRLRDEVEVEISMLDFFDSPTIAQQSELLEALLLADSDATAEHAELSR